MLIGIADLHLWPGTFSSVGRWVVSSVHTKMRRSEACTATAYDKRTRANSRYMNMKTAMTSKTRRCSYCELIFYRNEVQTPDQDEAVIEAMDRIDGVLRR